MSTSSEYELNCWDLLRSDEPDVLSSIYETDVDYYFDEDTDIFVAPHIMPYVKIKDLNDSANTDECIKPKSAIEVGVKINF